MIETERNPSKSAVQKLIGTDHFISHVKGNEQSPFRFENSPHFAEDSWQQIFGNVHDRVKGDNSRQTSILKRKGEHVSNPKRYVRIESLGLLHHSRGEALISPVGRDLSRHWRFTWVAAAIAEDQSLSDRVARSGEKSASNIAPQCNPIERIVVGKAA